MRRSSDTFQTVKTEGAILPSDLLRRIINGDPDVPGLRPEDYHLARSERLNEAATRAWNRLQGAWQGFKEAMGSLPEADTGTSITRERWLLILFQELGYGRLTARRAHEIGGKTYPISHEWQNTPIHLVSFRLELDKRTPGRAGAARVSPHSLVQEFLGRSDDHLWGIVANGLTLRLLRDNVSLTRQAYVEFDLQAMLDSDAYSDFFLLFLLCHQSRVEVPEGRTPEHCWLEKWYNTAAQQGVRALDQLRDGVQHAIEALGGGYLAYPANADLRERLHSGQLSTQDYYRQVLRQVYRLLFLFVAEDRDLLFDPAAPVETRRLYGEHYSAQRLRALAAKTRRTRHPDLWRVFRLVLGKLHMGCAQLGLPALGSYLFDPQSTAELNEIDIANSDLLKAIRSLAFTVDRTVLRPVNYRNLGPEELGSVYESLLEMHPAIQMGATLPDERFKLTVAAGSERKTTGSYYTPSSLVNCLLDSALNPILDEACRKENPEQVLLDLKICDPACGSGHFLIAAAHRVAKRLAAIRAGEDEPPPASYQQALRDVIGRCIYGVDINPMSVELCKISLWMEALEPGKPLAFLDHHIQCGNSLLGATPALMKRGIPDDAFQPIEGDDRGVCSELKRRNRQERQGQGLLPFGAPPWLRLGNLVQSFANLSDEDDSTPEALAAKQQHFVDLVRSAPYENARLLADAWCAAFVCEKRSNAPLEITEAVFRRWEENPHSILPADKEALLGLRGQYVSFHWHLAFPEVFKPKPDDQIANDERTGWSGGFDLVLGNPPWDTLSPDAKEFFSSYDPGVRNEDKIGQQRIISGLLDQPPIRQRWDWYCRQLYTLVHFLKNSGCFRLYAPGNLGKGDFNVFRMFVELALTLCARDGWAAQIVPEGLYNGANSMAIRQELFDLFTLTRLLCFTNTRRLWFAGVHASAKFCLYAACKRDSTQCFPASFNISSTSALADAMAGKTLLIPVSVVREFSPDALAIAEVNSQFDIDIASKAYSRCPKFGDEMAGPPYRTYMREIDMGTDRDLFSEDPEGLALYEGRMVNHFDHRAKGYRSGRGRSAVWEELPFGSPAKSIQPQWYIPHDQVPDKAQERCRTFRIGFCDVGSPTNERTLVAAIVPPGSICGHSLPTFIYPDGFTWAYLLWAAVANSFCADFIVRSRVSLHVTFTILDSIPFPRLPANHPVSQALVYRALLLTCTASDMNPLWNLMAQEGWLPAITHSSTSMGALDQDSRLVLLAEIEAIVALCVYGLSREELEYVLETFPIVKRREEQAYGHYGSRDLILDIYDEMAEMMDANATAVTAGRQPTACYRTRLNPPPGPPCDAASNFIPMAQWDQAIWDRYKDVIHQPREERVPTTVTVPVVPAAEQIEEGVAVLYALALLYVWGKPADRRSFELGMILMTKDDLRSRVLKKQPSPRARSGAAAANVGRMDEFLGELVGSSTLQVENTRNRQLVTLGTKAPARDVLLADRDGKAAFAKARDTVQAVGILAEQSQSLDLYIGAEDYGAIEIALS